MQVPTPQLPLNRPSIDGPKRETTSIVPGAGTPTGKSKRKGAAKGKKDAKAGELDRVVREDAGIVALTELTGDELDERSGRPRWLEGQDPCDQPPGHQAGSFPVEGHAFQPSARGGWQPPVFSDVSQGNLSDAWLLASFAAVAQSQPSNILDRIEEVGAGVFDISLGNELIRTTAEFPAEGYADPYPNGQADTLWVALLEKAFAVREAGSYAHLECGNPSRALEALTGRPARRRALTPYVNRAEVHSVLLQAEESARPVVVTTRDTDLPGPLIGDHAYAVLGAAGRKDRVGSVRLYNPWGTRGATRPLESVVHEVDLEALLDAATALHIG